MPVTRLQHESFSVNGQPPMLTGTKTTAQWEEGTVLLVLIVPREFIPRCTIENIAFQ